MSDPRYWEHEEWAEFDDRYSDTESAQIAHEAITIIASDVSAVEREIYKLDIKDS